MTQNARVPMPQPEDPSKPPKVRPLSVEAARKAAGKPEVAKPANIIGPAVPETSEPEKLVAQLPKGAREAIAASRMIPDCPTCGKPPRQHNIGTAERPHMVLLPCQHQVDALAEVEAAKERHEQQKRYKARLGEFPPPPKHQRVKLADIRLAEPNGDYSGSKHGRVVAQWYLENWPEMRKMGAGMLFTGTPGTGKTMTSAAIANELDQRGYYVVWTKIKSLFDRLHGDFAVKNRILEAVETCDLLVLDELIGEKDTPALLREVIRLLDLRAEAERPTIVTSNFTVELISGQIDAILSRENGDELAAEMVRRFRSRFLPPYIKVVSFRGPDMRLRQRRDWGPELSADEVEA